MPSVPFLPSLKSLIEKIGGDGNKIFDFHPDNRKIETHIHFDLSKITPDQAKTFEAIKELLAPELQKTEFQLPSKSSEKDLEQIEAFSSGEQQNELYKFISSSIPEQDRYLWLSALMLRSARIAGDRLRVMTIKDQMVAQSGQKGRNIANICNSGYLEEYIIPWYKHYVEEEKNPDSFTENYKLIVEQLLFIVFVSSTSSVDTIKSEIENKIRSLQNAHRNKLVVHALGENNIQLAEAAITELQKEDCPIVDVRTTKTRSTLKAELVF